MVWWRSTWKFVANRRTKRCPWIRGVLRNVHHFSRKSPTMSTMSCLGRTETWLLFWGRYLPKWSISQSMSVLKLAHSLCISSRFGHQQSNTWKIQRTYARYFSILRLRILQRFPNNPSTFEFRDAPYWKLLTSNQGQRRVHRSCWSDQFQPSSDSCWRSKARGSKEWNQTWENHTRNEI